MTTVEGVLRSLRKHRSTLCEERHLRAMRALIVLFDGGNFIFGNSDVLQTCLSIASPSRVWFESRQNFSNLFADSNLLRGDNDIELARLLRRNLFHGKREC